MLWFEANPLRAGFARVNNALDAVLPVSTFGSMGNCNMRIKIGLCLACGIALAISGCAKAPLGQLEKVVQRIRTQTQYVDVKPANLIFDSGPQPLVQYVLTLSGRAEGSRDAAYLFESSRYALDNFGGTPVEVPTSEICALIDSIADSSDPLENALDRIEASGTVTISPRGPSAEVKFKGSARNVIELYYALGEMLTLRSLRAEVLVRGFADGEVASWQRELDPSYPYSSVEVMPPVDSAAPIMFKRKRETIPVSEAPLYSNKDLPNLRARYVKDVLLDPYLARCPGETAASSAILQGFAYDEASRPLDRKVQVYVVFYEHS